MKSSLFFVVFIFSTALAGQIHKPFKWVKIPFVWENNTIIIQVKINNHTAHLILDTGAKNIIMTNPEILKENEMKNFKPILIRGLGSEQIIEGFYSDNNDFKIKDVLFEKYPVIWLKEKLIDFSKYYKHPVDGVLGSRFLKDFVLEINYKNKFIKLYNPAFYHKRHKKKIPIRLIDTKPVVQLHILGQQTLMQIDTGNNDAVWWFGKIPEKYKYKLVYSYLGMGVTGQIFGYATLLESLKFGGVGFREIPLSVPDSASMKHILIAHHQGLIGNSLLKKFKVIIHYPERYLILKKYIWENRQIPFDKSGLIVKLTKPKIFEIENLHMEPEDSENLNTSFAWKYQTETYVKYIETKLIEVEDIVPGSPAEKAGILKGDIIEKINGKEVYEMKSLSDFTYYLSGKEGKKVYLTVNRNGIRMKFTFRLKNYFISNKT